MLNLPTTPNYRGSNSDAANSLLGRYATQNFADTAAANADINQFRGQNANAANAANTGYIAENRATGNAATNALNQSPIPVMLPRVTQIQAFAATFHRTTTLTISSTDFWEII